MFPGRYYPTRMFADRYFAKTGLTSILVYGPARVTASAVYVPGGKAAAVYQPGGLAGAVYVPGGKAGAAQ